MLEREIAIYKKYQAEGWKVSFVTYGTVEDLTYQHQLGDIQILCNQWNFPPRIYRDYLHILHAEAFQDGDVIKTNQFNGAEIASKAAEMWQIPLVIRCGYLWSSLGEEYYSRNKTPQPIIEAARKLEHKLFNQAQGIIVSTARIKEHIEDAYQVPGSNITVVPNYVDTDVFAPDREKAIPNRISCVAKFNEQKNLMSLFEACACLDIELDLVGSGPLEAPLVSSKEENQLRVNFLGNLPNQSLPPVINRSEIFVLVSFFEGHPKALVEAMSCGKPVIGANVPGINEIITHKENGYLCETDPQSIRSAISELLAEKELQIRMGKKARLYALEQYSLEKLFEQERAFIEQVEKGPSRKRVANIHPVYRFLVLPFLFLVKLAVAIRSRVVGQQQS